MWYRIRGKDMKIDKPRGMVIEFWLYADTKDKLDKLLSEKQIKTLDSTKSKINPCIKNPEFCSLINKRIEKTRKQLLGLNLQARIEKNHKQLIEKRKKD